MFKFSTIIGAGMALAIGTAQANAGDDASIRAPTVSCSTLLKVAGTRGHGSGAYYSMSDDAIDYVRSLPHADKLGYGSDCHLNDLIMAECRLHRNGSVLDAIYSLMSKAETGKKLPETPVCGA